MANKDKLKVIAGELRKASATHKAQAKKIDSMSKGFKMTIMPNIAGSLKQNLKIQDIGQNLFEGQALADQMQLRRTDKPVMPPAPDPVAPLYMVDDEKVSDTLFLPNRFKKQEGKTIDETDYDNLSKKIKNYKRKPVEDLQDLGKIKINKQGKPYVVNRKN